MAEKKHFYVPEFMENIKNQDIIKGIIILEHLKEMDSNTRSEILRLLETCDESYSLLLLSEFLSTNPQCMEDNPELKDMLTEKIENNPVIANWLPPEIASVLLIEALNNASSEKKMVDIIITLGEIGDEQCVGNLADLLYSGSWDLTKTAVEALGQIRSEAAIEHLMKRLGSDEECDQILLQAIAATETKQAYQILCDYLGSPHAGSRNQAKALLFKAGKPALPFLFENLKKKDPDLLIHTFNVLGLIGEESSVKPIRQFLFHAPEDANVRFAAYEALGNFKLSGSSFILASGLEDEDEGVRTAVAKAIDRNLDPILNQGIRNMLRDEDEKAAELVHLFLNSEAEVVFEKLLDHKFFKLASVQYLKDQAHKTIQKKFVNILQRKGENTLVNLILSSVIKSSSDKPVIWAIDDSRMILRMYRTYLHSLGYEPLVFEFPEQACEKLASQKPALIFTDLNMPKLTGIDVARKVREHYTSAELPIIMVTTQSENDDHSEALNAGITKIMQKPFTKDLLDETISSFL